MRFRSAASAIAAVICLIAVIPLSPGLAQYFVTAGEAKAMLYKAIAALKEDEAAALEAFSDGGHGFVDRELYIICFNTKTGKITAPQGTDTDIRTLTDLGPKFYDAATALKEDGSITTIKYEYPMHSGGEPVSKEMYVTRVRDQGCGTMLFRAD